MNVDTWLDQLGADANPCTSHAQLHRDATARPSNPARLRPHSVTAPATTKAVRDAGFHHPAYNPTLSAAQRDDADSYSSDEIPLEDSEDDFQGDLCPQHSDPLIHHFHCGFRQVCYIPEAHYPFTSYPAFFHALMRPPDSLSHAPCSL